MKEIITENFKKLSSDLITFPSLFSRREKVIPNSSDNESVEEIKKKWENPIRKKKKKKNIYQLNLNTEDIDVEDFGQTELGQSS